MLPFLQIGPLAIPMPGLILLCGLWLGLTLSEWHAHRYKLSAKDIYYLAMVGLLTALAGARLAYFVRYPEAFMQSPASLFSLNAGLLDPIAGALIGLVAASFYGQRKGMPFWSTLDALTPALAVVAVAIPLSNLASGAAFGAPTNLPWAIDLWGAARHPTQIYETLAAALILLILWPGRPRIKANVPGEYFLQFIALSAGARLFLEAFRGDSSLLPGGIRSAQISAWLVLAASIWMMKRLSNPSRPLRSNPPPE